MDQQKKYTLINLNPMPFQLLYDLLPEVAVAETRTIYILGEENKHNLPKGSYSFVEGFCNEVSCNCRRVFFSVYYSSGIQSMPEKEPLAIIGYGWESMAFYKKWMGNNDKKTAKHLTTPILNELSPQSEHARKILKLFTDILLTDKQYMERVKQHYRLFRARL